MGRPFAFDLASAPVQFALAMVLAVGLGTAISAVVTQEPSVDPTEITGSIPERGTSRPAARPASPALAEPAHRVTEPPLWTLVKEKLPFLAD